MKLQTLTFLLGTLLLSHGGSAAEGPFTLFLPKEQFASMMQNRVDKKKEDQFSEKVVMIFGGGELKVIGDRNKIYLLPGAKLVLNGTSNQVFARQESNVSVEGATNQIRYEDGVKLSDSGVGSIVEVVDSLSVKPGAPPAPAVVNDEPEVKGIATGPAEMVPSAPPAVAPPKMAVNPAAPVPDSAVAAVNQAPPGCAVMTPADAATPPSGNPAPPGNGEAPKVGPGGVAPDMKTSDPAPAIGNNAGGAPTADGKQAALQVGSPISAAEKEKWDEAMGLIGKFAPSVVELVRLLPGSSEEEAADQTPSGVEDPSEVIGTAPPETLEIDPSLVGEWKIEDISTSDARLALFALKMIGSFTFAEDGTGFMKSNLGVKGIALDRSAAFIWGAGEEELIINKGSDNESTWKRSKETEDFQKASITTKDGTELVLESRRVTE